MKKVKTILMATLLLTMALPVYANSDEEDGDVKVVYQCDFSNPKRVHLMLNTINNAVEFYNKNFISYEIDIVALGPCLQYMMKNFKKTDFEEKPYITHGGPTEAGTRGRLKSLQLTGGDSIKFYACKNTMDNKHVKEDQIEDFAKLTPAGIVKIIDLQQKGYAYIKID